jgi:hypothetical protein
MIEGERTRTPHLHHRDKPPFDGRGFVGWPIGLTARRCMAHRPEETSQIYQRVIHGSQNGTYLRIQQRREYSDTRGGVSSCQKTFNKRMSWRPTLGKGRGLLCATQLPWDGRHGHLQDTSLHPCCLLIKPHHHLRYCRKDSIYFYFGWGIAAPYTYVTLVMYVASVITVGNVRVLCL